MHISQKLVFLFFMVVISAVSAVAQPVPSGSLWSMYRHDPQHTGLSPLTGDIGAPQMVWSFPTSGLKRSSAAVGDIDQDGKMEVVTVTWDYGVHALNAEDGSLLWLNSDGPYATASPALVDIDDDGDLDDDLEKALVAQAAQTIA